MKIIEFRVLIKINIIVKILSCIIPRICNQFLLYKDDNLQCFLKDGSIIVTEYDQIYMLICYNLQN